MKKHFYEKKLAECNDFYLLRNILVEIFRELNDKDFSDELFNKLKKQANSTYHYIELARISFQSYNNFSEANEYIKKAIDLAKTSYDYGAISGFVSSCLGDRSFAEILHNEAKRLEEEAKNKRKDNF